MRAAMLVVVVLLCASGKASAQSSWENVTLEPINGGYNFPGPTGSARLDDVIGVHRWTEGTGGVTTSSIPLGQFATADSVARLGAQFSRVAEGAALAAAVTIVPPNAGDRFSITVSGAGYGSHFAASASVSYRMTNEIMTFGAIAQGRSQTLVKGGMSFSFR